MLEVGASPSLILFSTRGSGSDGLGSGEIRSTSATRGGSKTALDLKEEKKEEEKKKINKPEQGLTLSTNKQHS